MATTVGRKTAVRSIRTCLAGPSSRRARPKPTTIEPVTATTASRTVWPTAAIRSGSENARVKLAVPTYSLPR